MQMAFMKCITTSLRSTPAVTIDKCTGVNYRKRNPLNSCLHAYNLIAPNDSIVLIMPLLEIQFSFQYKELVIVFPEPHVALAYQRKNPESRILMNEDKNNVYLPVPASLSHIRTSSSRNDFVFVFTTEDAANSWVKHSVLSELYPKNAKSSKEAFIDIAYWDHENLYGKLDIDEEESAGNIVCSPSPSPSQRHIIHLGNASGSIQSSQSH
jgi:hypothetical protein